MISTSKLTSTHTKYGFEVGSLISMLANRTEEMRSVLQMFQGTLLYISERTF